MYRYVEADQSRQCCCSVAYSLIAFLMYFAVLFLSAVFIVHRVPLSFYCFIDVFVMMPGRLQCWLFSFWAWILGHC